MSGKCRPSLRPKTLYNVDRSSLSTTDKECIHSVFELADHQKSEIEKNEKIIKAANDLIETQKAEIERLDKEVDRLSQVVLYHDGHIADARVEAIKAFAERLKEQYEIWDDDEYYFNYVTTDQIDNLVKEMVGDAE